MKKIVILLLFFTQGALASLYPVVTSMVAKYGEYGVDAHYYVNVQLLDIGPAADFVPAATQWILYGHRHIESVKDVFATDDMLQADGKSTVGELATKLFAGKTQDVIYHRGNNYPLKECVGYVLSLGGYSWVPWSQIVTPGGCLAAPPADEWCKITTPEIVLDHGTITLKQAEGNVATTQMSLRCTSAMAVSFNLITEDKYVYLDQGKSEIKVNDLPLKTKIDLPQGDSSLPVKDLLTGINSEGFHTGSSVLVMMPY